jgi:1A family penicillin-binding protein
MITDQSTDQPARQPDRAHGPFSLVAMASALGAVAVVVLVVLLAAYQTCGFDGCPNVQQVAGFVPEEASVVLDRDGEEVDKLFRVNRVVVGLDSLPEHVPEAFVATEDQNFYDHSGVDFPRVIGAMVQNIRSGGIAEGFSTITMQVARNVFPERLPMHQRTLNRKIAEIRVARQIESRYSKQEILELYMNQIYFGSGAWGIEAAAQEYFGKPATALNLAEASLLAGLPQAPSRLNPRENMEGALERRATVLRRMESAGYIDAEQAASAGETEPELARSRMGAPTRAAYFVEHVRRLVEERLGDVVYTGGYRIHTTLDAGAQEAVEQALSQQLEAIEAGRYGGFPHRSYASVVGDTARVINTARTPYLQGAALVMDVRSGDVLAMVGGRDFEDSRFNRATQAKRQPGSAFKPFVYAAALQAGHPPSTVLEDAPYRLVQDGRVWEPRNYDGSYAGDITMRNALVRSQNIATVRLAERVGLDRVISTARSLGISSDIPRYPSVAIGAAEVSLQEMVTAYAALASLGERPEPRYVTHVTDRHGRVVWQVAPRTAFAVSPEVAFITIDLMRDVVDRGTGTPVRAAGFRQPAAGKTGTTNESADVWFVGATPRVAAGIWIGLDERQRIMPRATGGRLAAPVWGRMMARIATDGSSWSPPSGIERRQVDSFGNVLGANCPTYGDTREEYFLRGTVYAGECPGLGTPYDTLYQDTFGDERDGWWQRLRERVLRQDETEPLPDPDTLPDTIIMRPPPDSPRPGTTPPDPGTTPPDPEPAPSPPGEPPIGEPVIPDTLGGPPPGGTGGNGGGR